MPGGVNPPDSPVAPTETPKLHDSSLSQGDVSMLQEGQQMMRQAQKPASGGQQAAPQARPAPNVQVPDAIDFIGGRAGGSFNANTIGQNPPGRVDMSRWRPLMEELARDPNTSGALSTAILSRLSSVSQESGTVGVDIIDINAAEDMAWESLR